MYYIDFISYVQVPYSLSDLGQVIRTRLIVVQSGFQKGLSEINKMNVAIKRSTKILG